MKFNTILDTINYKNYNILALMIQNHENKKNFKNLMNANVQHTNYIKKT